MLHQFRLVPANLQTSVLTDIFGPVVTNKNVLVMFYDNIFILLGMQENLLFPLLVLETQFIEPTTSKTGVGFDSAFRFLCRKGIGRHVHRMIDTSCNQRPVRISFDEINNYFVTNAGDMDCPPA